jgi:hypothetical protein
MRKPRRYPAMLITVDESFGTKFNDIESYVSNCQSNVFFPTVKETAMPDKETDMFVATRAAIFRTYFVAYDASDA